jgi:hypothetical protein
MIGEAGEHPDFRAGANPLARKGIYAGRGSARFGRIVLRNVKHAHQANILKALMGL